MKPPLVEGFVSERGREAVAVAGEAVDGGMPHGDFVGEV